MFSCGSGNDVTDLVSIKRNTVCNVLIVVADTQSVLPLGEQSLLFKMRFSGLGGWISEVGWTWVAKEAQRNRLKGWGMRNMSLSITCWGRQSCKQRGMEMLKCCYFRRTDS